MNLTNQIPQNKAVDIAFDFAGYRERSHTPRFGHLPPEGDDPSHGVENGRSGRADDH